MVSLIDLFTNTKVAHYGPLFSLFLFHPIRLFLAKYFGPQQDGLITSYAEVVSTDTLIATADTVAWTNENITTPLAEPLNEGIIQSIIGIEKGLSWYNKNVNEPILNSSTVSLEIPVSANIPGLEGTASLGVFHLDQGKNIALGTTSFGGGGTTDVLGFSGGLQLTVTSGEKLGALAGNTVYGYGEIEAYVARAGMQPLVLPGGESGVSFYIAVGPEVPFVLPASGGGGASRTIDGAMYTNKVTENGREQCAIINCSLSSPDD